MKNPTLLIAILLSLVFAGGLTWRMNTKTQEFETMVETSLKTSEGYDEKFETMVNRLEVILATRAEFGYEGSKDPMTGKKRRIVRAKPKKNKGKKAKVEEVVEKKEEVDPVKLTAIIEDDVGGYTAVVMNGDRSLSVSKGEKVMTRTVTSISEDAVIMKDEKYIYRYDFSGNKSKIEWGNPALKKESEPSDAPSGEVKPKGSSKAPAKSSPKKSVAKTTSKAPAAKTEPAKAKKEAEIKPQ